MHRRILVVKLADVGDALTATPAVRALRQRFPDAGLDVLVRKYGILLWNNQGRWGLVSPSQLAEWLRGYRLFKRQKEQFPRLTVKAPTIDFRSTTPLSDSVARVLRSQRPQELNQPKAKPKPPTAH